jgi:hypothetical protein
MVQKTKKHSQIARERYSKAKSELELARKAFETKNLTKLDDSLFRYRTAKRALNLAEEKYKRLAGIRQRLIERGNKERAKKVETEMMHTEKEIETMYSRIDALGDQIKLLHKAQSE